MVEQVQSRCQADFPGQRPAAVEPVAALQADGLDGWLLYDFRGTNAIAEGLVGLTGQHVTRRWFYFIPATGTPRKLNHAIEPRKLDALPAQERIVLRRSLDYPEDSAGRLMQTTLVAAPPFWTGFRDPPKGYLTAGAAPDASRFLPPPPEAGSLRDQDDVDRYRATRALSGARCG